MAELAKNGSVEKSVISKDQILEILGDANRDFSQVQGRFKALRHYLDTPVPDRVGHLWRYSDPAVFLPDEIVAAVNVGGVSTDSIPPGSDNEIRLVPGQAPIVTLSPEVSVAGVEIKPLASSERGIALLGGAVAFDHGLFESLNGAIWSAGVFVRVPAGIRLEQPLRIVSLPEPGTGASRVVIEAERDSALNLVEEYREGYETTVLLTVTELFVSPGAAVSHVMAQDLAKGARAHVTSRADVGRDAASQTGVIQLGGGYCKADVGAVLSGVGASSVIAGVSLTGGRQHMDLHTVHHHTAPKTRSNINFKSALTGKSESAYTGLIRVDEGATLSEAYQENRNLMLSNRCRAEAIPELEIHTNEVQCSHAATSAPIDPDQLFYLKSRGIEEGAAIQLLVRGFFEKALALIPENFRADIEARVDARLRGLVRKGVS